MPLRRLCGARSAQKGGRFRVTRCHSFLLSSVPAALTQLGTALHFYGITFRSASSPQAKGKIERSHQDWQNRLPALWAAGTIASIAPLNALLDTLCLHRDTHARHRELAMTPLAAWRLAPKEGRCALRQAPQCPSWPYIFNQRSSIRVQPDGRVAVGSHRLRVHAPPGTRLVHCLHPNTDLSVLRLPPAPGSKPQLLLHLPATT